MPRSTIVSSASIYTAEDIRAYQTLKIRTPQELLDWIRFTLGVMIPAKRVCKHHSSPFEAICHSFFAWSTPTIWWGSRGFAGKTMGLATLCLAEAINLNADIRLLGGSSEQSRRVYAYFDGQENSAKNKFWQAAHAPVWMRIGTSTAFTRLRYGGVLRCLAASQTSIRGAHPNRLRIDEADELPWKLYIASQGLTMSTDPSAPAAQTTISSTWQHPDGTFTKILEEARKKDHKIFSWCYHETSEPHGWLPKSEITRKKGETNDLMWEIEYDLAEPLGDARAINPQAIEDMFDPNLGEWEGDPNEYHPIWTERPSDLHVYYSGTDWAKAVDLTVVVTGRKPGPDEPPNAPDYFVGYTCMNRAPWPNMVAAQERQVKRYWGASYHDAGGVGGVLHDYLTHPSEPIILQGKRRVEIFQAYITAIEHRQIKCPRINRMYKEHKYLTHDQMYSSSSHCPDTFVAGALAWYARQGGVATAAQFQPESALMELLPPELKDRLRVEEFKPSELIEFGRRGYWTSDVTPETRIGGYEFSDPVDFSSYNLDAGFAQLFATV